MSSYLYSAIRFMLMINNKIKLFLVGGAFTLLIGAGLMFYFSSNVQFKRNLLSPVISEQVKSDVVELNDFYRLHYSSDLARYISKKYFGVQLIKVYEKTGNLIKGSFNGDIESYASLYVSVDLDYEDGEASSPGAYFVSYLADNKSSLLQYNSSDVLDAAVAKDSDYYESFVSSLPITYFFDVADDYVVTLIVDDLRLPLPLKVDDLDYMLNNLKMAGAQ